MHTRLAGFERYAGFDRDIYAAALAEAQRIGVEVLAPVNKIGDRDGCKLDADGNVTTPHGYKAAWDTLAAGGWVAASAPAELGGAGLPFLMAMAINEILCGACMAFMMYPGLTAGAARVIAAHGPEALRESFATAMFSGRWGGTMCLTEAGAGSSVGDNRSKAIPTDEEGVYLLEGEKIFISGGDQDLTENIVHLVLARTPNAGRGTKGLSLFMVPKFLVGADGSLGARNGAHVLGIEHKMGIHGNATCTLGLGTRGPCKGWLVGQENQGIELMFLMMNEARIGVAVQAQAVACAAYNRALAYARERVQGQALRDMKTPDAASVTIVHHPDVRRMLMQQKVYTETMRSLLFKLALAFDVLHETQDEAERERLRARVDLYTPIVKATCTDLGFEVATLAVQTFGGYGYIGEYPVEQYLRDVKITSIYEGTNGIQAMDLVGRKLRVGGGALFIQWMGEANTAVEEAGKAGFGDAGAAMGKAMHSLAGAAMHLAGLGKARRVEGAMLQATPFTRMFGLVLLGLEALDQAVVARRLQHDRPDDPRLAGKLRNLEFYIANVLPQAIALGKTITSGDESCLDPALF
ncbi:MAG: acyl-CoA dehydrogenase [Myxococcales bacterium]|nr:acyl-CoA dehydrogenase [Myxococcales bacterium]